MLDPVLPIALYLMIGYFFKIFIKDNSQALVDFVIYFSLPAMVFIKIYPLALDFKFLNMIFMFNTIILANLVLTYFIGKFLKFEKKTLATFMAVGTFGNTSFVGFSYIDAFYGQDYVVYALIYDLFGSFLLVVSLGSIIVNWGSGELIKFKAMTRKVLFFPPIIMFFVTIILKFFTVPTFVMNTASAIGATVVPVAMIAIGMKLEVKNIFYKFKTVSLLLGIKMFLMPILVMIGFSIFYNLDDTWSKATILEVAMPPMTMAVILAIQGGLDERLAVNALVIGVLLSLLSVTGFYYFLA
ncbi:Auxin Efflux Carrier [Arcobacter nitrofigilis DSM 7299]|uniref:Auxin Efflux Carrier n=1 Tax=Arcobacter nitrofigilis (strain ATCC 33309 / DSM 7299 / CCUG 15893 / LMG 7604 / NCTC 12251 / CI) TaxID=572480 RepID=D5V140_ARCNC|nr:AEC family transporter [Arcobacter nitrofigilis]ADG94002.1 Auxin Efflux Carrier [Arcobacter nitrofigilis DSM 7299]